MPKTVIEIAIALILTIVFVILFSARKKISPRHLGFDLLLSGICLVTIAAWMDSAEIQDRFNESPNLRDTLLYVELIAGYLFGVILVGAGLSFWFPALVRFQEENKKRLVAERMMKLHFDNTPLGVITWNTNLTIRDWNPGAQKIFGYSREEAIGKQLTQLVPELGMESEAPSHQRLQGDAPVVTDTVTTRGKDGRKVTCEWHSIRLVNIEGEFKGYASSVVDVTERIEAEREYKSEHSLLQRLVDAAPGIFYMFDENRHMVRWNRAYELALGQSSDQIKEQDAILDVVVENDIPNALAEIEHAFETGKGAVEVRMVHSSGIETPYLATGAAIECGNEKCIAGIAIDISELKETQRSLEIRNDSLELLNDLSDRLHRTHDTDFIARETITALVTHRDPPMAAFYLIEESGNSLRLLADNGFDEETRRKGQQLPLEGSLSGIAVREQQVVISEDISLDNRLEKKVQKELMKHGFQHAISIPLVTQDGCLGVINMVYRHALDMRSKDLETWRAVGQTVALALANAGHLHQMEYQALHDSLTNLGNRAFLHQDCQRQLSVAKKNKQRLALLLIDIDRFKEFNDALGHDTGDELLKMIGPRLNSALDQHHSTVCRLSGDAFATMVPLETSDPNGIVVAENLLKCLRKPFHLDGMALELSASIGIALYPDHGDDSQTLLRCADIAMYHAKGIAEPVSIYHIDKDQHTPERLAMMVDLAPAIRNDEMVLLYQPKINLPGKALQGFEALVRWQHPKLGLLPPGRFIPLVETSELIHDLTRKVLALSIKQSKSWQDQGIEASVAVNLSARNLMDNNLVESISDLLDKHEVPAQRLELEITETTLMLEPEQARQQLEKIADLGVKLSVDDFGTGYSSLAYLKRLPVEVLKVDRSFVSDILVDAQDRVIVESTIRMAHSLGLEVVAEGVEDEATIDVLSSLECDFAQGYYIAKPMLPNDVVSWLDKWLQEESSGLYK